MLLSAREKHPALRGALRPWEQAAVLHGAVRQHLLIRVSRRPPATPYHLETTDLRLAPDALEALGPPYLNRALVRARDEVELHKVHAPDARDRPRARAGIHVTVSWLIRRRTARPISHAAVLGRRGSAPAGRPPVVRGSLRTLKSIARDRYVPRTHRCGRYEHSMRSSAHRRRARRSSVRPVRPRKHATGISRRCLPGHPFCG